MSLISYANRGMDIENKVNEANEYYIKHDIAYIYKKEIPINIVRVKGAKIVEAYYSKKSTTDYFGIYKGYYIDFETKQTNTDKFNLTTNLHAHQINHLINIKNHGGISFLLIFFNKYDKIYLIEINSLLGFVYQRKSQIDISFFKEKGYELNMNSKLFNYIKVIDIFIERFEHEKINYKENNKKNNKKASGKEKK